MYINKTILGILLIFLMLITVGPVVANNYLFKNNNRPIDSNRRLFNDNLVIAKKISFKKTKVKEEISVHPQCFQEAFTNELILSLLYTKEWSVNKKEFGKLKKIENEKAEAKKKSAKSERKGRVKKCELPGNDEEFVRVLATAYTAQRCTAKTATDTKPRWGVVAVDPKYIPLGSEIYIKNMGWFTAEDTGGKVKGKRIDIYYPTRRQAIHFGVKKLSIKVFPKKKKKNYRM